jgi:hypothetical protein
MKDQPTHMPSKESFRHPDLETLKGICFKQNVSPELYGHYRRSWATYYPIYVTHKISIRLVWLLVRTPVLPVHVTFLSYFFGFGAGLFFLKADLPLTFFTGALALEIFYILDAVDGQLARAKGVSSKGGALLDEWGNFLVAPFVVFCIGMNRLIESPWFAALASYSILAIPLIDILKDRHYSMESIMKKGYSWQQPGFSLPSQLYSLLYRSCTMPVIMNLVTLLSVLSLFNVISLKSLSFLISYYAIVGAAVWILKGLYGGLKANDASAPQ